MGKEITFRRLKMEDLPLLYKWFHEPHVDRWWHQACDFSKIVEKYEPRISGAEPTYVYVIQCNESPIGIIQWYRWSDYSDHALQLGADLSAAGMDLAIGEKSALGQGLGWRSIRDFVHKVIFVDPSISACMADPELENHQSLRAFEKAGFRQIKTVQLSGEKVRRCVVRVDR